MTYKVIIREISGNEITNFEYEEIDDIEIKKIKLEESLNNIIIKNKCIYNNNIIVLINDNNLIYINFIYLENENLIFSIYKNFTNHFVNNHNEYLLICMNINTDINYLDKIFNDYYTYDFNVDLVQDYYFAYFFVSINGNILYYLSNEFKENKEIVLIAVENSGYALEFVSDKFKEDEEIVIEAIKEDGNAIQFASNTLKKNKSFILEAVKRQGYILKYLDDTLKSNKEIVLEAVKNTGCSLQYASIELQNDREVVDEAINENNDAFEYASLFLKNIIIKENIYPFKL